MIKSTLMGILTLSAAWSMAACAEETFDNRPPDASPCMTAEECEEPTPICHPSLGVCSQCVETTDCDGGVCDMSSRTCVQCLEGSDCPSGECNDETNTCEGCTTNDECTQADASRCDTSAGQCAPCTAHADCAHLSPTPACNDATGTCVECTPDTEEERCGPPENRACDPTTLTCTGAERGTLGFCEPCVSDSECASSPTQGVQRCVAMTFGEPSAPHGTYCLLDLQSHRDALGEPTANCPNRMRVEREARSVLDDEEVTYCFPREAVTTCEAILDFGGDCTGDEDCGAAGLDDGSCSATSKCTYECLGATDCGPGSSCTGVGTTFCDPG